MSAPGSRTAPLRVAVVIPTHWERRMGGSQYQAKLLIERLHDDYDASITYFAARAPDVRQFHDHRVVCVGRSGPLRKFGHFWDYFRLQKALEAFAPDVIYQRVCCSYTGIAARYSRRSGVPMVWHIASESDCRKPPPLWTALRRPHKWLDARLATSGILGADVIVAQTEDQASLLEANFGRSPDKLIRNFHPRPLAPTKPDDRFTIVWIANFKPLKRPEVFVEIAARLKDRENIEFLMVGEPYSSGTLRTRFEDTMREARNIRCLGTMPQDEVNAILDQAHLLVNTSKWEGFSNTFIQAWMRAVPVLTLGINPDRVLDNRAIGRSCASIDEIADIIRELADKPETLSSMGKDARQFALSHFSMGNAAELAELLVETARSRDACPQRA